MTPTPQQAPTPAPRLRLVTDPGDALSVLAMPTKFDPGYPPRDRLPDDPPSWEPNWSGIQNRFTVSLRDALTHRWDDDAHVVGYLRRGCTVQRRLNKNPAPDHWIGCNENPQDCDTLDDVATHFVMLDWDRPDHEQRTNVAEDLKAEREAIEAAFAAGLPRPFALFPTRGGWRPVYVLAEPVPVSEIEPYLRGLIHRAQLAGLGEGCILETDELCKEWNRHFRLPNVMRDGAPTWEADYMAPRVEFLNPNPLDIRAEIQPREKPQREHNTESAPVEPFDLDTLSEVMRGRVKAYAARALENAAQRIVDAPVKKGRTTTYNQALSIGQLIAVPDLLDENEAETQLFAAIEKRHEKRDPQKIDDKKAKVREGFNDGEKRPFDVRQLVERWQYLDGLAQNADKPQQAPMTDTATAVDSDPVQDPEPEPDLPECPLELFPPVLGNFVRSVARTVQIAPDLPALFALATVSAALSRRVATIKVGVTHEEVPALWVVVGQASGDRKSSASGLVTGPLRELERRHLERFAALERAYLNRKGIHDERLKKLKAEAASDANKGDNSGVLQRLAELEAQPPIPPTSPALITSDTTPEAAKVRMQRQNGRLFVCAPEGGIFERLADDKQKTPDLDPFLCGHAGDPIVEDRVGRPPVLVRQPVVNLAIATQPSVVAKLLANSRFAGTGFLARMLIASPESMVGFRTADDEALNAGAVAAYSACLARLYDGSTDANVVLRCEGEALAVHRAFRLAIERRLAPGQDLAAGGVVSWASKLPGAVARIAAVFHAAEHGCNVLAIGADAVRRAVEFANRYLIPHALHAFTSAAEVEPMDAGEIVGQFLREATEPALGAEVAIGDLEAAFAAWCAKQGHNITETAFGRELTKLGFRPERNAKGDRVRKGMMLRQPSTGDNPRHL